MLSLPRELAFSHKSELYSKGVTPFVVQFQRWAGPIGGAGPRGCPRIFQAFLKSTAYSVADFSSSLALSVFILIIWKRWPDFY